MLWVSQSRFYSIPLELMQGVGRPTMRGLFGLYFYLCPHAFHFFTATIKNQKFKGVRQLKKLFKLLSTLLLVVLLVACAPVSNETLQENSMEANGYYTSQEDVSLYLIEYGELPNNYLTKKEAKNLGWVAREGNLWDVSDKLSIGGDRFGNREGLLPDKKGRLYYEADINYKGGHRNAERLVYSDDGLIYYTDDHYDSYTLLYGEE